MPNPCNFDRIIEGKAVKLITLQNANGMAVWLTNFGARIVGAVVPDKIGGMRDVIPGFNSLDGYRRPNGIYMGALIGNHQTEWETVKYIFTDSETPLDVCGSDLPGNNGFEGFHRHIWDIDGYDRQFARFSYSSEHDRRLLLSVTYTLTDDNALKIVYKAESKEPVVLDMTNLVYFNLNGEGNSSVLRHNLKMKAGHYFPLSEEGLPTNECAGVEDSPFDFRRGRSFVSSIYDHHRQLSIGNGYNHNFVLDNHYLSSAAAQVIADESRILLKVYTDLPVLRLNTGNDLAGRNIMRSGMPDLKHTMFALMPQQLTNLPGSGNLFSNILNPDQPYRQTTIYQFFNI